jgi:hypothetical protein
MTEEITRTCKECKQFVKDTVGDGTGIGHCKHGVRKKYPCLWPNIPACKRFEDARDN